MNIGPGDDKKNASLESRESIRQGICVVLGLAGWALAVWWFIELSG